MPVFTCLYRKKQEKRKVSKSKEERPSKPAEEKKAREEIKITPLEEDFPPEKPKPDKKKPEPEFDEGQEPAEGDEESEYFYYY